MIEQLAKSGLILRADPPKVIELKGRAWGEMVGGLALSAAPKTGAPNILSLILRNAGDAPCSLVVPGWLHFFSVHVTAPGGLPAPFTAYGRAALAPDQDRTRLEVRLEPQQSVEVELPVTLLFEMKTPGTHIVRAEYPALTLRSNPCEFDL